MSRTTITILVSLFVAAVAGMFLVSYWLQPTSEDASDTTEPTPDTVTDTAPTTVITAKHFYEDGLHTLVGEIEMPTPCDLLEYDTVIRESFPEQVEVNFTVINTAETCAQVITPQRFMVEVEASEEAVFSARFRGEPTEFNLVPAAAGETPDEFELYIKG